jgi:hypothetical protein
VKRLWRLFTSLETTAALLVLLASLLLLNVMLPQEAVVGREAFARAAVSSRAAHFFLVTLGLGRLATSPVFLGALALFFLNLAAVLAARAGPTWRRTRVKPRPEAALQAWAATGEGLTGPRPEGLGLAGVIEILRGYGYPARKVGEGVVWGVKHRLAPLGFLIFHLSFFLLCAGGLLVYYTRFVGTVTLTEGQEHDGAAASTTEVLRSPPVGGPPPLRFTLEEVDPRFEAGEPVHLGATLRFPRGVVQTARVNHPARWGSTSVLVQRAGLAPVLWLQDERGYTLDRVAVAAPTRGTEATRVPLGGGGMTVEVGPLGPDVPFPSRGELADTELALRVLDGERVLFDGSLSPGRVADLGPRGRLVLAELRYWAGMLVVAERGGGLLILGFALGVVGLLWRLLLYRREVAVLWDEETFTVLGRGEYYRGRFHEELEAICSTLRDNEGDPGRATT